MQPQEAGGIDWWHGLTGLGGGAIGTLMTWIWRAARIEPKIRADFQADIRAAEEQLEAKIDAVEHQAEAKVESMTGHFHEYFEGIRRQQDDLRQNFVRKEDFKEWRDELRTMIREDREERRREAAELKSNIAKILGEKQ